MSFLIHTFCHGTCKLSLLHCGVVFFSSFRVPLKQLHIPSAHFPKWATALSQRERYKSIIANRFSKFNTQFCLFSVIFVNFLLIFLEFPILADYCFLELDGHTIFATHGHHHNPKNPPMLKKGDILLNGHTHIPAHQDNGTFIYMNPGSVSIPKENSAHGYMIYDGEFHWKQLDGTEIPMPLS